VDEMLRHQETVDRQLHRHKEEAERKLRRIAEELDRQLVSKGSEGGV
jgi:hypothetical protein